MKVIEKGGGGMSEFSLGEWVFLEISVFLEVIWKIRVREYLKRLEEFFKKLRV